MTEVSLEIKSYHPNLWLPTPNLLEVTPPKPQPYSKPIPAFTVPYYLRNARPKIKEMPKRVPVTRSRARRKHIKLWSLAI